MNYQETIDFLFESLPMFQRLGKAAYKANLDNTIALDNALGHPHRKFRSVHIAGTNGKGSVSHMLASVFQEAGYKTGLYTSPHMIDFRERIRINGEMIGEQQVVDFVGSNKEVIDKIKPSFFEMTVAMAFDHFAREKVDIAIVETGMGGRLDSTNIITPEVSVITSISLDHMEFLGENEALIAAEKAGIIKNKIPCISGKNTLQVNEVLEKVAAEKNTQLIYSDRKRNFEYQTFTIDNASIFHYRDLLVPGKTRITSDLGGAYQGENINIVLTTIETLKERSWEIPREAVSRGLAAVRKNTSLLGRWEILGANPRVICDTAHNEAGIRIVMEQLQNVPAKNIHIVWGMVGDKSIEKILPLLPANAVYYFTQPSIPRAMPVDIMVEKARDAGLSGSNHKLVEEAFKAALKNAETEDTIFIGGSTFVVADLLLYLQNQGMQKNKRAG